MNEAVKAACVSAPAIRYLIVTPSPEDVAYYEGMIAAIEQAHAAGRASAIYDGEHVDLAHAKMARDVITLARAFAARSG